MKWQKLLICLSLGCVVASALADPPPIIGSGTSNGVLDQVVDEFATKAKGWQTVIMGAASWLFWTLGTISFTWTMGMMAIRKADLQEFFAEFTRFVIFFGFFYWLLKNGPYFADTIIQSLRQIGAKASGGTALMHPSDLVNTGLKIWQDSLDAITMTAPIDSAVNVILAIGMLILLALIAVNMLLLLISGWMLMYAGIFFLGFGGSRWTSDIAINYYKTVLGIGAQLLAMILVVGIGVDLLNSFHAQMGKGLANLNEEGAMLVLCLAILVLSSKLPAMLAGMINGHGIGHVGTTAGGFMGAAVGAAAVAGAAAATAGSALMAGGANIAGGAQALMAAFKQANALEGAGGGGSMLATVSSGGGDAAGGGSALAAAMGSVAGAESTQPDAGNSASYAAGEAASSGSAQDKGIVAAANAKPGASAGADGLAPGEVPKSSALRAAGAIAAKAGRVAAGTAANLALGTYDVGKARLGDLKNRALDRVGQTTGGQIASAINARGAADKNTSPSFGDDSLAAAPEPADRESEVAAFRDRT
jgi:type IV secretion system protein TrbL